MAQLHRARSRATQASCEAYLAYIDEADRDGVRTPEESEIISLLETAYEINELKDAADEAAIQLMRTPEGFPHKHVARRLRELTERWEQRRILYGSDSAPRRRGLVHIEEDRAA